MLAGVGAVVAVAVAIDGLAVVRAAATLLGPQCGEDIAWLALVLAGLGASLAPSIAVAGAAWWWWQRRPPPALRWAAGAVVTVVGAMATLAAVAVLWLPDGGCA